LVNLYATSLIYWHCAGYGVNDKEHPEQVEHFGIAPIEAMAAGAVTFCYNAGGPKEVITDTENGFLFNTQEELIQKTVVVLDNAELQHKIRDHAKQLVQQKFSYDSFKKRVLEVVKV
jgi:glycosyltransferase involved in cell wall biosynthesis